jgi:hypothetical protein
MSAGLLILTAVLFGVICYLSGFAVGRARTIERANEQPCIYCGRSPRWLSWEDKPSV